MGSSPDCIVYNSWISVAWRFFCRSKISYPIFLFLRPIFDVFFFGGGWNSSWYTFLLGIFIVEFLNDTFLNQISAGLERAKLRR